MSSKNKVHVKTIWISDTHLGSKGCQAGKLLNFLKSYKCEQLYMVGDIIDGWRMKKSIFWPQAHTNVLRKVLSLSKKKESKVIYITGNHDEFLRKYSNTDFGNILLVDEAEHITVDGKRLLVTHGDKYDVIVRYHKWLAFVGDNAYNLMLVINRWYNIIREKLGYGYWSLSAYLKQKVKTAVSFIGEYEVALVKECERRDFDGVVCGHIHHAEIKEIEGKMYYNSGDWVESCTALVEDFDGNITIVNWLETDKDNEFIEDDEDLESGLESGLESDIETGSSVEDKVLEALT